MNCHGRTFPYCCSTYTRISFLIFLCVHKRFYSFSPNFSLNLASSSSQFMRFPSGSHESYSWPKPAHRIRYSLEPPLVTLWSNIAATSSPSSLLSAAACIPERHGYDMCDCLCESALAVPSLGLEVATSFFPPFATHKHQ